MSLHRIVFLFLSLLVCSAAHAQGFSVLVTPPRIEASAKIGSVYRNVIEITNVSDASSHLRVYTSDWSLDENAAAVFDNKLAADSCRPWAGIEAKEITIGPRGKRRFRFEVAIPKDTLPRECRFAIMIEGDPETVKGKLAVPVSGRIGVIVYLAIGDVAPNLKILTTAIKNMNGQRLPAIKVNNIGNAHSRLEGYAELVDAKGKRWTVVPENFPVLAGETRLIALVPQVEENKPIPELAYPVKITGKLDAGKERIPTDFVIGP